jgi:tetratricopeptide (TPR) repeat protein
MNPQPSKQTQQLLNQGVQWLQKGDLDRASGLFSSALDLSPADPDALHMMGVVAKNQNRLNDAETFFRRSLEAEARQPQVLNNLANLLRGTDRVDEAIGLYEKAVTMQPEFADGWFNLGLTHQARASHPAAIEAFRKAQAIKPGDPRFSNSLGVSYKELDRLEEAIEAYDQALTSKPEHFRSLHNKGVALRLKPDPVAAIECYRKALRISSNVPELRFNLACALHDAGRIDESEQELKLAIELRPEYLEAHETLNKMYWETGNPEPFCESYVAATRRSPRSAELRAEHACMLEMADRFDEAEEVLRQGIRDNGDHADLHHGLAKATGRRGETATSLSHFARAIQADPDKQPIRIDVSRYLIQLGNYDEALQHLDEAERLNPLDQEMWAYRGLCWRFLGDERDAWLNDYDRFVQARQLETPEGYDNLEHFLTELRRVLIGMHDTVTHPIDQSLKGGTQTAGRLIHQPIKEIQDFRRVLEKQIDDYLASLPKDPSHPFLGRLSGEYRFSGSWSVRLNSEGFHVNHVHPAGWLSGPTYIEVPAVIRDDDETRAGWVKFGETGLNLGPDRERVGKAVRPAEGLVAFFPSYIWHGTYPLVSEEHRMTAPMDYLPV